MPASPAMPAVPSEHQPLQDNWSEGCPDPCPAPRIHSVQTELLTASSSSPAYHQTSLWSALRSGCALPPEALSPHQRQKRPPAAAAHQPEPSELHPCSGRMQLLSHPVLLRSELLYLPSYSVQSPCYEQMYQHCQYSVHSPSAAMLSLPSHRPAEKKPAPHASPPLCCFSADTHHRLAHSCLPVHSAHPHPETSSMYRTFPLASHPVRHPRCLFAECLHLQSLKYTPARSDHSTPVKTKAQRSQPPDPPNFSDTLQVLSWFPPSYFLFLLL